MLISGYPKGSDITLMNTMYQYPYKMDNGKYSKDKIMIVYKDNITGKKSTAVIESPQHEFYKIKDEYADEYLSNVYQPFFIEKEKCDKIICPHHDLEKKIAELTDDMAFYKANIANGNRSENRRLHTNPTILFSDTDIEDHYRYKFNNEYTNNISKLDKGYFDIEVDIKYQKGDFPEPGECPINCCSYLDEKTNTIYTFILRNNENPLIEEFENSLNDELYKELHDFVVEKVGGWKQATRFGLMNTKFKLLFYDTELELLSNMFRLFHRIDPDFILVWNMSFDLPYIMSRIENLGYDIRDIMCNQSFKDEDKIVYYYYDTRHKNEPAERTDYINITGNITWLDQMVQFCSRRKAKIASFPNFKLDTIGQISAKVKKLSYKHITTDLGKLPYLDFKIFVFYNIMDVVVQKCIESKSNDIEYIFAKCLVNNTSYRKGHRQTVYLINRISEEFYKEGLIICNNCNRWNPKPTTKFAGAIVAEPTLTDDYSKMKIGNNAVMIVENLLDEDYKALYPSILLEHNIAPNTLIGHIEMPEKIYENENSYAYMQNENENMKYSRSGEFIENLVSENHIEFCKRYFYLAGFKEFIFEDIPEYMSKYSNRNLLTPYKQGIYFCSALKRNGQGIYFEDYKKPAIYFYESEPIDYNKYREELRRRTGL